MRVRIGGDEWYPVYSFVSWVSDPEVDIPDDKYQECCELFKAFEDMQMYLADLSEQARKKELFEKSKQGIPAYGFN